jgi:hypothetical protein
VQDAVQSAEEYVAAVPAGHRPLFERVDRLLRTGRDDLEVDLSYGILRYRRPGSARARRPALHLGVWKHGVSLYGWSADHDGGFGARHPELLSSRGTLKLSLARAGAVSDEDLTALFAAVLDG